MFGKCECTLKTEMREKNVYIFFDDFLFYIRPVLISLPPMVSDPLGYKDLYYSKDG